VQIHVVLTARDAFGNAAVQAAGASFALSLSSGAAGDTRSPLSGGLAAVPRGLGAGLAYAGFRLPAPGAFRLTAALGGDATSGSPFTLQSGELGVASPPHMRAVGTALQVAAAGDAARVAVFAADASGRRHSSGGTFLQAALSRVGSAAVGAARATDHGDGRYTVEFVATAAGAYRLAIEALGQPICGSPFFVRVRPGTANASRALVAGAGLTLATAGEAAGFRVLARDAFGNAAAVGALDGAAWLRVALAGPAASAPLQPLEPLPPSPRTEAALLDDGAAAVSYNATAAGRYTVWVLGAAGGSGAAAHLAGSPFALVVRPRGAHAPASAAAGAGTLRGAAGDALHVALDVRDPFGNAAALPEAAAGGAEGEEGGAARVEMELSGPAAGGTLHAAHNATRRGAGHYAFAYSVTRAGMYAAALHIPGLAGGALPGGAFAVAVGPAAPAAAASTASMPGGPAWVVTEAGTVVVTTADRFGNAVRSGGAAVAVRAVIGGAELHAEVEDLQDGSYAGVFRGLALGAAAVTATLGGTPVGTGAPLAVTVGAGPADPAATARASFEPLTAAAGAGVSLLVAPRDSRGFRTARSDANFSAALAPAGPPVALRASTAEGAGVLAVEFAATCAGAYRLAVLLGSAHVCGSPFRVAVRAGAPHPQGAALAGAGLSAATAGAAATFALVLRDRFGNTAAAGPFEDPGALSASLTRAAGGAPLAPRLVGAGVGKKGSNARFDFSFLATRAGDYALAVALSGAPVANASVRVAPAALNAAASLLSVSRTELAPGDTVEVALAPRDRFGNAAAPGRGGLPSVRGSAPREPEAGDDVADDDVARWSIDTPMRAGGDGTWRWNGALAAAGVHALGVWLGDAPAADAPFAVLVTAGAPPTPPLCTNRTRRVLHPVLIGHACR
jgi:hypothetical protein